MKVLVIGSGGREHTLAWKIKQSPHLTKLYCAPGNAGTVGLAENVNIGGSDLDGLVRFAHSEGIDLTVVGPEAPLVDGIVDRFKEEGLRIVGPSAKAAQLEGSKVFTKDFMKARGIPSAEYQVYSDAEDAVSDLKAGRFKFPTVVKADGLAAGKGVFICQDLEEALDAVNAVMTARQFGSSGDRIVIEEFLVGEETSFMVFTDGTNLIPMVPSQDHKAAYDGDTGPNTGGMGAYSVDFLLSQELRDQIMDQIMRPTVEGMKEMGYPFEGVLYAGLMLTKEGPKVLEFNVRFGDPETQVILPRLKSDLLATFDAMADGDLSGHQVEWHSDAAVCIVIASEGYPGSYPKGHEISGMAMAEEDPGTIVFHAGTDLKEGKTVTSGGRVLGVTSLAPNLQAAIMRAYEAVNKIHFDGMYYRKDIAAKGLRKLTKD